MKLGAETILIDVRAQKSKHEISQGIVEKETKLQSDNFTGLISDQCAAKWLNRSFFSNVRHRDGSGSILVVQWRRFSFKR